MATGSINNKSKQVNVRVPHEVLEDIESVKDKRVPPVFLSSPPWADQTSECKSQMTTVKITWLLSSN
jgi:hypothetical protein